jgi:hypothetical protein
VARRAPLALLLALAACGDAGAAVRGTLRGDALPASGTLYVWSEGGERVAVEGGGFELEGAAPGDLALRFGAGEDPVARMELRGLPEGAELELRGIRFDRESGLAFPASVALRGAETVLVNGLRMAPPGALPGRVEADGEVLAISGSADALLVRPADARLPDLRVVVTPATETVTAQGDPASLEGVEPGDSLRVVGMTDDGYLIAGRIVVPGASAARGAEDAPAAPVAAPAREEAARPREGGEVREEEPREREDRAEREERGRDERPGKGKGRGKGRGKKDKG